jgi:hypothetical protein
MDQADARNGCTETCHLRLINIIMGDVYYMQLISESRANTWRGEIDQGMTGQDSQYGSMFGNHLKMAVSMSGQISVLGIKDSKIEPATLLILANASLPGQ